VDAAEVVVMSATPTSSSYASKAVVVHELRIATTSASTRRANSWSALRPVRRFGSFSLLIRCRLRPQPDGHDPVEAAEGASAG
jgi:hypothetical protein